MKAQRLYLGPIYTEGEGSGRPADYVVLRTMLLFSRVDVTLHAGGGTPGGCSVYGMTAAAQLYREVIGCRPSHVQSNDYMLIQNIRHHSNL